MLNSGLRVFGAFFGNSQQTLADPEHYSNRPPTVSAGVMSVNAIRIQL